MRNYKLTLTGTFAVLAMLATQPAFANELTNPGFEQNVGAYNNGNNFPGSVVGWTFGSGQAPNVVKVDGPTGYNYGTNGPESDANSATGANTPQHYLDIANGSNSFYQTFTPECSGNVTFGGSFSSRANRRASGSIAIREGNSLTGTLVGTTNAVTSPSGNSQFTPWTDVSYTTSLNGGTTYSFVVTMDNDSNFDDGFVEFDNCPGTEEVSLCCTPWTETKLRGSLQPVAGPGGIGSNYAVNYQTVAASNNAMEAYANYLNVVNSAFDNLRVEYEVLNYGTNTSPNSTGTSVPGATNKTVTHFGNSTSSSSFWTGNLFQENVWYGFKTRVTARDASGNDLSLFENENAAGEPLCADAGIYYRVQSMSMGNARIAGIAGRAAPLMLQISNGKKIIATEPLAQSIGRPVKPTDFKRFIPRRGN